MNEEIICSKSPSQLLNIKAYLSAILVMAIIIGLYILGKDRFELTPLILLLLILPVLTIVWHFLKIKCQRYELTNERLRMISGVLNRKTEEVELYRIKDFTLNEPFLMRIFKLGDILIESSDKSMPFIKIKALPQATEFKEHLRTYVEEIRLKKNVREVDFE